VFRSPNYKTSAGSSDNPISATTSSTFPSTQASAIVFNDVATESITIQWTNGNGGNRIVAMKEGSGTITNPTDNTTYTASADWDISFNG